MLKPFLIAAALLASGFASAEQKSPPSPELVYSLAERPIGIVVGDRCEIRGAVWGYGPRPGVNMALIDVVAARVYPAKTNAYGVYSLSIPYAGKAIVLQERIADQVYAEQAVAKKIRVRDGGVVCDHRLIQTFPSTQTKDAL